jgi:hypothetical protein
MHFFGSFLSEFYWPKSLLSHLSKPNGETCFSLSNWPWQNITNLKPIRKVESFRISIQTFIEDIFFCTHIKKMAVKTASSYILTWHACRICRWHHDWKYSESLMRQYWVNFWLRRRTRVNSQRNLQITRSKLWEALSDLFFYWKLSIFLYFLLWSETVYKKSYPELKKIRMVMLFCNLYLECTLGKEVWVLQKKRKRKTAATES